MTTTATPRAALPLLAAAQAQKHVTHNAALLQLDALLFARFLSRNVSVPPPTPADGDTYLVKATASGAWTGQNGQIAYANGGVWQFAAPFTGLTAYVVDESKLIVFNGTSWVDYASTLALQNVPLLGVNASADATNKLAVSSSALLFNNIGNGVQVKLNKNASTDTASLLYQTSFSGRAEFGLTGDDKFHFKVSPNGASFTEALCIDNTTGNVGVRTTTPVRVLSVSNAGAEGLEIGPGNANGDAAGAVTSVYFNRSLSAYVDAIQSAATHRWQIAGTEAARISANGHVLVGTLTDAALLSVGGSANFAGAVTVQTGSNTLQSSAILGAINSGSGNDFEWGHQNTTGFRSHIGHNNANGASFLGFNAEAGTTNDTFRTRGFVGAVVQGTGPGTALSFNSVANSNADNQSLTEMGRFLLSNGHFLLGTLTDSAMLSVGGTANVAGAATFGGVVTANGNYFSALNGATALISSTDGSFGFQIRNLGTGAHGLRFTNYGAGTEYFRVDSSGNVLIGRTATLNGNHCAAATSTNPAIDVVNAHASSPVGATITYSAAAPNGTANNFLACVDSAATRVQLRSNGGIANFSANNVNLSDVRVKQAVEQLADMSAELWSAHRDVRWARFKYHDQTHDDWNYGYIAQDIQEQFRAVAPELVDRWDETPSDGGLLAVHHEDLHNIGHAVLSVAQRRIEAVEAENEKLRAALADTVKRVAALESKRKS
ncbi:MAG TPA: DUF2793 domain-containing protein [Rhizomicrobium sp.]|nr:DUF2793 domain-containing protein [Rhizomicrobium sp.]